MSIKLVVFDLDGTLLDSVQDLAQAVNVTLRQLSPGVEPLDVSVVASFVGDGIGKLLARSLERAGLSHGVEQAQPLLLEAYEGCMLETTRLYPGVEETLDALADRLLAVLTNKPGGMSRTILDSLGVGGRFLRVLGGDEAPRKPNPDGLRALMKEAGTTPETTVMVGDSAVDVETARAAGVPVVGVSYGLKPEGLRTAGPNIVLDDLRRLPDEIERMSMLL